MYEPISCYGNYFIGIDGEGMGNDYTLLGCSLSDYPRLYTGARLTTLECLDWLWGLGKHAGYGTFVLYGARYDYDNWMRDLSYDWELVKRYAAGHLVRVGPYAVIHQEGYHFDLRRVESENLSEDLYSPKRIRKYSRYQTRTTFDSRHRVDKTRIEFWDVLPWWQTKFTKALDMTLGDRALHRQLIEEGKEARSSFTHDNIEWVSRYNHAECLNLGLMMVELDSWLQEVDIRPTAYNGPGAASKAMLRAHMPYLHAGRIINGTAKKPVSRRLGKYFFPGTPKPNPLTMLHAALCAYAGGRNQAPKIGYDPGSAHEYDINSAYPAAAVSLPCLSHGSWVPTRDYVPEFSIYKIRYKASRKLRLYPFFYRLPDGSIIYPPEFAERWVYGCELRAGLAVDPSGIRILDGWKWDAGVCDNPYPFWWIPDAAKRRLAYKEAGASGPSIALKLPLNSLYGSLAQARGGTVANPPWSQQLLWAGWITAHTRSKLYLAGMLADAGESVIHMATDGIITTKPIPVAIGNGLGEWEYTPLHEFTAVQYGVYFAKKADDSWKYRIRGFFINEESVPEFVSTIHSMWSEGHWRNLEVPQRLFITSGLASQSETRLQEWCHWQDTTRLIELDTDTPFSFGQALDLGRFYDVQGMHGVNGIRLAASAPYTPKWGVGANFPREWVEDDELEKAYAVAQV